MNTKLHCIVLFFVFIISSFTSCIKDEDYKTNAIDPSTAPVIITSPVSDVTNVSARCGGKITEDGGSIILKRGICWSTLPNPTLNDENTANGAGIGSFTSTMTGLTLGTTYYVRAYATNNVSTSYGPQQVFSTSATYTMGIKHAGGVIFYLDSTMEHGLICAEIDQSTSASWGCSTQEISGADLSSIGSGSSNTADIVTECSSSSSAAAICSNLTLNGYNDWFLPSKDELKLIFNNLKLGGISTFRNTAYWSSTEMTNSFAWQVIFTDGNSQGGGKNSSCAVRAVRAF